MALQATVEKYRDNHLFIAGLITGKVHFSLLHKDFLLGGRQGTVLSNIEDILIHRNNVTDHFNS